MRRMILQKFITWCESLFPFVHQNGTTTEIGGNLEVDGDISSQPVYYNGLITGLTIYSQYTKLCKIGNVLMLVCSALGTIDSEIPTSTTIFKAEIPKEIADKLIPLEGSTAGFISQVDIFYAWNQRYIGYVYKAHDTTTDKYYLGVSTWTNTIPISTDQAQLSIRASFIL